MRGHYTVAGIALAALLTSIVIGSGSPARAGQSNGSLIVEATVPQSCNVSGDSSGRLAAGTLNFGTHPPVGESLFASSADLFVRCTFLSSFLTISFDAGLHPATARGPRQMFGPSGTLAPYTLFQDSALTQPWTPNVPYPVAVTTTNNILIPVYGATVASSNLLDGTYDDVVQVTITY